MAQASSRLRFLAYFVFPLENKTNVSFTYPVWNSLHYDVAQKLFRECQLHTFDYKKAVYARINPQKAINKTNLGIFLGSKQKSLRILRL